MTTTAGRVEAWDPGLRRGRLVSEGSPPMLFHFWAVDCPAGVPPVGALVDFVPVVGARTRTARTVRQRRPDGPTG
jgi:hypothetical protein